MRTDEGKAEVKSVTEQWVEEGIEQGKIQGFILLYKKGHISLDVAIKELGVSKEEFLEMVSKDEQPVEPVS